MSFFFIQIYTHPKQDNQIVFNETRITSFEFFTHPLYSSFDRRKHDIGLVRIKGGLPDNGYVRPICLNGRKPERRERCFVAGWGSTGADQRAYSPELMEAMVPMMDVRACGRPDSYGKSFDDKAMICAGYWSGQTDTCVGDSGGPLVCIDEHLQPHVAGIISWGKGCGRAHYPGVYTRVSYYLEWIKSVIEGTAPVSASGDAINSINLSSGPKKQRKENKKQGKIVIGVIDKPKPNGLAGRSESYQAPQKPPLTFTTLGSLDFSNYDPSKGFSASNAPVETTTMIPDITTESVVTVSDTYVEMDTVAERRGVDFDDDFIDDTTTSSTDYNSTDNPGRRDEDLMGSARKYYNAGDKNSRTIGTRTPCGDLFAKYNVNLNVEG